MKLGINLSSVNYWTFPVPFLDRMKASGTWAPQSKAANYTMVPMGKEPARFVMTYEGVATFALRNSTVATSDSGRIVFDWLGTSNGQMQLVVKSGLPVNIRIVREDRIALFASGEIFEPDFLAPLTGMSHFRAMDWMTTNGSKRADVLLEADGSYNTGAPLSVIIALANKTGLRPWINLPAHITDEAITATFDYIDAHLRSDLRAIAEFSNEVWNGAFEANDFATAQSAALKRGSGSAAYWYGQQVARVSKLAKGHRVGIVVMWQFVGAGRMVSDVLPGFTDAGGTDLEAIGGANYLYGTLNDWKGTDGPTLMAANDIDGALANVAAQLPANAALHAKWADLAHSHGWENWTYEGGNYHLNTIWFPAPTPKPLAAFYEAVQNDPRAAANIKAEMVNAQAEGVDALTIYNDRSTSSVDGYFGILNTPASFKVYQDYMVQSALPSLADIRARAQSVVDDLDKLIGAAA